MNPGGQGQLRVAAWAVADQAISSVGNLTLVVVVARTSTLPSFGAYGVAFSIYLFFCGLCRFTAGTIYTLSLNDDGSCAQRARGGLVGAFVMVGILAAILSAPLVALKGSAITDFLLTIGLLMPGLLWVDGIRQAVLSERQPQQACVLDGLWLLVQCVGFLAVHGMQSQSALAYVLAWGGSGTFVALVWAVRNRELPRLGEGIRLVRSEARLLPGLTGEFVATVGVAQALPLFLAAGIGLGAVGALRGAQALLGLANTALMGLAQVLLPTLRVAAHRGGEPFIQVIKRRYMVFGSCWLLAVTAAIVMIPEGLGVEFLGDSWEPAQALSLPLGITFTAQWALTVQMAHYRLLKAVGRAAVVRAGVGVAQIILTVGTAMAYGILPGVYAMSIASAFGVLVSQAQLNGVQRHSSE